MDLLIAIVPAMTTMSADNTDLRSFNRAPASKPATWHYKPRSEWNFAQRALNDIGLLQDPPHSKKPPVFDKSTPVPVYPVWRQHVWLLPRLLPPLLVHRAYMDLTGLTVHPVAAFFLYTVWLIHFGKMLFNMLKRMGKEYGFYDGQVARDGIPDIHGWKVFWSLIGVITVRPIFACFLAYDRTVKPSVSWKTPIDISAYSLLVDFFFYWYHRFMHEVPWLWQFHRLHHTTKHPNAAMSAYADNVQEWGDILFIPLLAYSVLRLDFTTWYLATSYIMYTEAAGHSGIRLYWQVPPTAFLRYFGCELSLENHDRHHLVGYRTSGDYGKQSRLWDGLFGTMRPRVESREENLDWVNTAVTV